jgi:hypothetical protein
MNRNRKWLGGWGVWTFGLLVLAFGLATSCYPDSTTNPRYVPPNDSIPDSNQNQGLILPAEPAGGVWV